MRLTLLTSVLLLFLPQTACADIPSSWTFTAAVPLWPLIESLYFWLYANLFLTRRPGLLKILGVTFFANIVTALLGWPINIHPSSLETRAFVGFVLFALIGSALFEWWIFVLFFKKDSVDKFDLLRISLVGNTITHTLIVALNRSGFTPL